MYPKQKKGIFAGISAGLFWGTPFFVPVVLGDFTAFEIMFGRFVFFGLVSALYLPRIIHLLRSLHKKELLQVFLFSAAGYWLYTFVLFLGIKLSNGVIASLILGCIPLTITLLTKPYFSVRLLFGLGFILIGMFFLLVLPLLQNNHAGSISILGISLLFMALALWTWFGIANYKFLHQHPHIKALDFSSTMGILSFLVVLPVFIAMVDVSSFVQHPHILNFLFWSAVLGIGASWIANILWMVCAKYCQGSILGALLISETLFALMYNFIYTWRLPNEYECIAILSLIMSVILIVTSQTQK